MEIVSKLLGHSSMKITQDSYGKVVMKKIRSSPRYKIVKVSFGIEVSLLFLQLILNPKTVNNPISKKYRFILFQLIIQSINILKTKPDLL